MRTEAIYTLIIAFIAAVGGYLLAPGRELALADIVLVNTVVLAVKMVFAVGLLYVLRGTKFDVLHEIFVENNSAAAIFTGLLLVAMVVGK